MALQLTGAAKTDSLANLQIRLPIVVIGGGLTAIDTATESLAYYVVQVEKFLHRYETLVTEKASRKCAPAGARKKPKSADEFIAHARAIRAERHAAAREAPRRDLIGLLNFLGWGHHCLSPPPRRLPSYTLNHEEVGKRSRKASDSPNAWRRSVDVDNYGAVKGMRFTLQRLGAEGSGKPATNTGRRRTRFRRGRHATEHGTRARTSRAFPAVDGKYFQACDEYGAPVKPEYSLSKPAHADILLSRLEDGRFISFFGDLHPSYFGNVVKAMGSAKQGYPVVSRVLAQHPPRSPLGTDASSRPCGTTCSPACTAWNGSLRPSSRW